MLSFEPVLNLDNPTKRIRRTRRWLFLGTALVLAAISIGWPTAVWGQRAPRYVAYFQDGTRQESNALIDWQTAEAQPKVENRALLDAANPARWLRDRSVIVGEPKGPYVETFSGDRFPGEVLAFRRGDESPYDIVPAHFEVRPDIALRTPPQQDAPFVRIIAAHVRRIVWEPRSRDELPPNTASLRDGGQLTFRAIRFSESGVSVLVDESFRRAPFGNLAELHVANENWWSTYFDELAALAPDGTSRLVQIATNDGLLATSSMARFTVIPQGGANEPQRWIHGWQPSWSLDVLWLPVSNIGTWRFFGPHEVPLSRVLPLRSLHRPLLGTITPIVRNGNVSRGPLRTAGQEFSWGFGSQASSRIEFPMHPSVKSFRSRFGIDDLAQGGGCVKFRVLHPAPTDAPRFDSPPVVGGQTPGDTGVIPLAWRDQGGCTLTLEADPAHAERPAGADPFDIRDFADWCDPTLELDPDRMKAELRSRTKRLTPAWQNWLVYGEPTSDLKRILIRDDGPAAAREFVSAIAAVNAPMVIYQHRNWAPRDRWMVLTVTRPVNATPQPKIEVRIGDELLGEFEPPLFDKANRDLVPILIPLNTIATQSPTADVLIRQLPQPQNVPLRWHGIRFTEHPPTLFRMFDDDDPFASADRDQPGGKDAGKGELPEGVSIVTDERYVGRRSLRVTMGREVTIPFGTTARIRDRPRLGEFRFVRFAFRKQGEGRIGFQFVRADPDDPLMLYDGGVGEPLDPAAKRAWTASLGKEWIVITKDLFADYGPADLTGLKLIVPDGEWAWIDGCYLARSQADLDLTTVPPTAPLNEQQQTEFRRGVAERAKTSVVSLEFPDGTGGRGIVLNAEGEILAAGHVVRGPNRDVTIRLADGKMIKGQTKGVHRTANLGLVKAIEGGPWTPMPLSTDRAPNPKTPYAAAGLKKEALVDDVQTQPLRRAFRDELWSEESVSEWFAGAPLFNASLQVTGLCVGPSRLGGLRWTNVAVIPEHLARLKNGEVWGNWSASAGPSCGWTLRMTDAGVEIAALERNAPAAKAGLMIGDLVLQIDGQPAPTIDSLQAVLGAKDPGQTIALDYRRGVAMARASLMLSNPKFGDDKTLGK